MRPTNILRETVRLHKFTKKPLSYVHMDSKYGHLVSIPDSDTPENN